MLGFQKLKEYKLNFKDINLVSFSQGPGQGHSLRVASIIAKTIAKTYKLKLIGVNHIKSHLEVGKFISNFKDPLYLNVTGVNSQVVAFKYSKYIVCGETEDIGLGNLLDFSARLLGFGFPGGPKIEKFANEGENLLDLPYTLKGMNVSFAGLKSHIKQIIERFEEDFSKKKSFTIQNIKYTSKKKFICDLCFSIQENVFAQLLEVTLRAIYYTKKKSLVLVGGVAANKRFVEMTKKMCSQEKIKYFSTPLSLCCDNGAMIALSGYIHKKKAKKNVESFLVKPYITIENEII